MSFRTRPTFNCCIRLDQLYTKEFNRSASNQVYPRYNNATPHMSYDLSSYSLYPPPSAFARSILSSNTFASRGHQSGSLPFPSHSPPRYPTPSESNQFFNQFLQSKTQEIKNARSAEFQMQQVHRQTQEVPPTNGQPYNNLPGAPEGPPTAYPQKRKATGEPAESPSVKRVHSVDQMNWSPMKQPDFQVDTPQRVPITDVPTVHPNQKPYIQVQHPPGWTTPKASIAAILQHRMPSQSTIDSSPLTATPSPKKGKGDGWYAGESDDDGYSSRNVPPSTQSRSGERDERSMFPRASNGHH